MIYAIFADIFRRLLRILIYPPSLRVSFQLTYIVYIVVPQLNRPYDPFQVLISVIGRDFLNNGLQAIVRDAILAFLPFRIVRPFLYDPHRS